jgi:hypothetical protein
MDWLLMRLTWWRWERCCACGRRVWGAYRGGTLAVVCDRADCPANEENEEPEPPVYATREDALRDVMRTGRAAVFEADERGEYRRTWQDPAPSAAPARETPPAPERCEHGVDAGRWCT